MEDLLLKYKVKLLDIINTHEANIINQLVSKIFVINLKEDKIRRKYILCLLKKYKINYTFVIVDKVKEDEYFFINKKNDLTKGECGCLLSHLWCLHEIIQKNYQNAIIFEDDIILHKNFINMFYKIQVQHNKRYDLLILGACDFSFATMHSTQTKNGLYRITKDSRRVYGAHANYYSLKGATKMFSLKKKDLGFFDKNYYSMFEYFTDTAYICYPNLVVSDISTTNLCHKYDFFTKNEEMYYSNCFVNFDYTQYNFIYLGILQKSKELRIQEDDTYESYMNKIIHYYFYNKKKENIIKNRLVMNFFTIHDVKKIIKNL
jgi:glycosyl transferase family 25